ncbi:MAG: family 10 glycosylhydrolase [Hydrogenoanaerobacterium sp.]
MKRIFAVILAAALALSVVGCAAEPVRNDALITAEGTLLSREDALDIIPSSEEFPSAEAAYIIQPPASDADIATAIPEKMPEKAVVKELAAKQDFTVVPVQEKAQEVRAMWFSYLDLIPMIQGKSKGDFRSNICTAFNNCAELGINTVIVHVRPFADALYDSDYFPYSYIVNESNTEGCNPGYDPLSIMVEEAHSRGLKIEAWINPYRVRKPGDKEAVSADSIATKWLNEKEDYVLSYKGGLYFNPARKDVQSLIVNGVCEVVKNYAVDGIHFDDYFYPSPDNKFDSVAYGEYKNSGGTKSLGDWRRENVNILVKRVYKAIKSIRKKCVFGISPQGNHSNNYSQQYIDVAKWGSQSGYVDYICPQIYWSYENTAAPYIYMLKSWEDMVTSPDVKLYIGLASYKIGGENDFKNATDMMKRQVEDAREVQHYGGFALYRYDSLFNPKASLRTQVSKEIANLNSIL